MRRIFSFTFVFLLIIFSLCITLPVQAVGAVTDVASVEELREALENDTGAHIRLEADILFTTKNAYDGDYGVLLGEGYYTINLNNHKIVYNRKGSNGDPVGVPLVMAETKGLVINGSGEIIGGTYGIEQNSHRGLLTINEGTVRGVIGSGIRMTMGIAVINGGTITGNFYGIFHEDGIVVLNGGSVKSVVYKSFGHPLQNYGIIKDGVFTGNANLEDVVLIRDNLTISKGSSIRVFRNGGLVVNNSFVNNGSMIYDGGLKSIYGEATLSNHAQVIIGTSMTFKSLTIEEHCHMTIKNGATVTVTGAYVNVNGGVYADNGTLVLQGSIDHRGHSAGIPELTAIEQNAHEEDQGTVDHVPSAWFTEEIESARNTWMNAGRLLSFYQHDIRREEFAELVVNLYEAMSGEAVSLPAATPFADTDIDHVLKANSLGIVNGRGAGVFDPDGKITRQEMAAMYARLLNALGIEAPVTDEYIIFADEKQISDYAKPPVQLMYKLDIIRGEGNNVFAPLKNATREQAIAISNRIFEKSNKI